MTLFIEGLLSFDLIIPIDFEKNATLYDAIAYDPVKTSLLESEAEAEEPTNHKARNRTLLLVYSSASASVSDNLVFTR